MHHIKFIIKINYKKNIIFRKLYSKIEHFTQPGEKQVLSSIIVKRVIKLKCISLS